MKRPRAGIALVILGVLVAACTSKHPPYIETVDCSIADLIDKINWANVTPGWGELTLAPDCEYQFTSVWNTRNVNGVDIANALPPIVGELKIIGNNATLSTNFAGSNVHFGLLHLRPEAFLKTDHLTIKNGWRALGGGVFMDHARAYFDATTFSGNIADGVQPNTPAEGGAIYNWEGSVTVIGDSVFKSNGALNGFLEPDLVSAGGGIFSSNGFLLAMRTTFEENVADSGGGIAIRRAAGGEGQEGTFISGSEFLDNHSSAIYAEGERTAFYISGVDFNQNESYNSGGALQIKDSILDLSGSDFTGNTAETCGAVDSSQNSELLVSSSEFSGNTARSSGGALCHTGDSLKINNSEFLSNQSGGYGGGVYATRPFSVSNATFNSNLAAEFGGGIYAGDSVDIRGSTLSENTGFRGGGLYAGWLPDSTTGPDITVYIWQSTFFGNQAWASNGSWDAAGGGIAFAGKQLDIQRSTIWRNQSTMGSGVYASDGIVNVVNSTISMNLYGVGAGLYLTEHVRASFLFATILDNQPLANSASLVASGWTTIKNSVVTSVGGPSACQFSGIGPFNAVGENLDNDGSCGFTLTNTNHGFFGVADNGGPTYTNRPAYYSPAVNAAADCDVYQVDQRGEPRPQSSACDLGAVELPDLGPAAPMPPDNTQTESPGSCEYQAAVNANCRAGDDVRTQLIKVLTKGDMLELLSLNPEFTHGLFALPDGRSCWVWMPLMEGPADPRNNCNATIVDPEPYVPEGPACSADLPKAQCEAAGGTMSGASSSASECICPSVASVTDPSTGPQSVACAGTGDRKQDPFTGLGILGTKFSILWFDL